jgi:hypothetical protein
MVRAKMTLFAKIVALGLCPALQSVPIAHADVVDLKCFFEVLR